MDSTTAELQHVRQRAATLLERCRSALDDPRLDDLARQLEEPLTIVLLGEFNSGKSALVNALLADAATEEGVVPTTDRITMISQAPTGSTDVAGERVLGRDLVEIRHPSSFLSGLRLVDTPGTNSVLERHTRITEEFLHRAELVIFVISSERGFTKSEKDFLAYIRGRWDRKLLCALNKIDLLDVTSARVVEQYVRDGFASHLDVVPEVIPVSARAARLAIEKGSEAGLESSGIPRLVQAIEQVVGGRERVALKLEATLSACERILRERGGSMRDRVAVLEGERAALREQGARIREDAAREVAMLIAEWRAAVDLDFVRELEGRVMTLGRLPGWRSATGPQGDRHGLQEARRRLQSGIAAACERLETTAGEAVTVVATSGPPTEAPEATAAQPGLVLPEPERRAAVRRLGTWAASSGLAAGGLIAACALGAIQLPVAAVGATAAGIVGLWRREEERSVLGRRLLDLRDRERLLGEEAARAAISARVEQLGSTLLDALATVEGEASELSESLGILDRLTATVWEVESLLETARRPGEPGVQA